MDDIERTIWRDRLRNRSCSMYGSEPLDVTNRQPAASTNEQYKVSCLHKLVDLVDLRWKTIAEAAYERDNPTAFEIPKWRITDHAQRYSARRTNPPHLGWPDCRAAGRCPGTRESDPPRWSGLYRPVDQIQEGGQPGWARSAVLRLALGLSSRSPFRRALFAVPDHRVPREADGSVVNAGSHPAHASNPSPLTPSIGLPHVWTTPRPYAPKPTSRKST